MSIASIFKIQQHDATLLLNIQYVRYFQTNSSEGSLQRSTAMCSVLRREYKNPRQTGRSCTIYHPQTKIKSLCFPLLLNGWSSLFTMPLIGKCVGSFFSSKMSLS